MLKNAEPKKKRVRKNKPKARLSYESMDGWYPPVFIEQIERTYSSGGHYTGYRSRYICFCGSEFTAREPAMNKGKHQSCGCLRGMGKGKATKHGKYKSDLYYCWAAMKQRCLYKKAKSYHSYGGRGIKVCERWMDFGNFYEDMHPRPSKIHSLDRIDNNGNYEPGNVRWATPKEQRKNQRKKEDW